MLPVVADLYATLQKKHHAVSGMQMSEDSQVMTTTIIPQNNTLLNQRRWHGR